MPYVVVGVWKMSDDAAALQLEMLRSRIVPGVKQAPGLIKGYWTRDPESGQSHTWIVFEDRPGAEAFALSVRANAGQQAEHGVTNVSLAITEVEAET